MLGGREQEPDPGAAHDATGGCRRPPQAHAPRQEPVVLELGGAEPPAPEVDVQARGAARV